MEPNAVLDGLADIIAAKMRQDPKYKVVASGTPTTNYMHGPGGIFGVSGLEHDLLSTRIQPRGLASILPAVGSIRMNPLFAYLTGFQATTGDNPTNVCDNCPQAGATKSCMQTAQFGRYCYRTKEVELNRVGQQTDRGEFLDLRLLNDPLLQEMGSILNMNIPGSPDLMREVLMAWVELGVAMQNTLIQQVYIGNPANNTGGGGYQEFPGLDILISTGKVDALTNTSCPSLDSDIKDFNYGLVCDNTPDIVNTISYMMRFLRHNATRMGFDPVQWVITMRTELFWETTACWPCSYLTQRCTVQDATKDRLNVDARDAVEMRDNMRQGNYLLIDGIRVPVILDDGIAEETDADSAQIAAGQFASDIYFIPLTVKGGFQATHWEYVDYSKGAIIGAADGHLGHHFWTDAGRFLWTFDHQNWCALWEAKIQPRIILRTPFLAGRIQNVRYEPLQHTRQPFPDDAYFVDGGRTGRPGPSLFSDWS